MGRVVVGYGEEDRGCVGQGRVFGGQGEAMMSRVEAMVSRVEAMVVVGTGKITASKVLTGMLTCLGLAMLTVFQCVTMENWIPILYSVRVFRKLQIYSTLIQITKPHLTPYIMYFMLYNNNYCGNEK